MSNEDRVQKYGKPQYFDGTEPYCPLEWTPPLSPDAPSDGPRARALACKLFKQENGKYLELDDYQIRLIDSILELYPDDYEVEHLRGCLRYRQAIVSIPRRNGKSTLASVLVTYSMLLSVAPNIGVLASTKEQAKEVFDNTKYNFENNEALKKRFKTTNSKGLESRRTDKPAHFKIHAGNGDGLQGITFVGNVPVVVDELHITKTEAYDAAVKGASTCLSAVVIGITTAGTEDSELLKRLYKTGQAAIAGGEDANPRFGFWHWTVAEGTELFDREALLRANPASQTNPPRIDIDQEILEGKANPAGDYAEFRRYRRNEFIHSEDIWLSLDVWAKANGKGIPEHYTGNVVYSIDKTQGWEWATVTAAAKIDDVVYTEMVCRIYQPNLEYLEQVCMYLYSNQRAELFVVNGMALRDLAINLREQHNLPAEYITEAQMVSATSTATSLIGTGRMIHADEPLMKRQLPNTVMKNSGEGVKISITHSTGEIDAVRSMVMAVYQAERMEMQDFKLIVL
ncbi:terminase large subunit domain-containing protein [Rhodococcus opacus]|uniref:Phage terminase family protein n=1 Tax=Rhodococcus opacus (strain B4) TaxID=632772 RepID=C1B4N2_RHOOB|nr:terminase large subunit [Rhodococcus opacus]BAH55221.1 phage terminase family protein [Rhodococcus opacus B4]